MNKPITESEAQDSVKRVRRLANKVIDVLGAEGESMSPNEILSAVNITFIAVCRATYGEEISVPDIYRAHANMMEIGFGGCKA